MNLVDLNKLINSELTSKILKSNIENNEILINVGTDNLYSTLLFLKTDENCKFKQLIDIVGADYPNSENRFKIYYLLLSHEKNLRVKVSINFDVDEKISQPNSIHQQIGWKEKYLICMELNLNHPI